MEKHDSLQMEMLVIACMLQDKEAFTYALSYLEGESFFYTSNKIIFNALKHMRGQKDIDIFTLAEHLKTMDLLSKIGGFTYLYKCQEMAPSSANYKSYVASVKEHSAWRKIEELSKFTNEQYKSNSMTLDDTITEVKKRLGDIQSYSIINNSLISANDALKKTLEEIQSRSEKKEKITTGIKVLDYQLGGLKKGELILIGARPSVGKTSLLTQIVASNVLREKRVLYISLEMPCNSILMRMVAQIEGYDLTTLTSEKFLYPSNRMLQQNVYKRLKQIGSNKIYFNSSNTMNIDELTVLANKINLEGGIDLIAIDYLQLMQGKKGLNNREREIADISRGLKLLAMELDVPIIACSQLSRASEQRTSKRPMLSDLRESGAIEQDADVVMLLHRENYYSHDKGDDSSEIIVAKNRNGETGVVYTRYIPENTKFEDV